MNQSLVNKINANQSHKILMTSGSSYLYWRLLQMAQIRSGLTRLMSKHHRVRVDQTKRINDNLAFHTLNGIDHDGYCPLGQRLKTLLSVDVHARQPAAKTRMRMVPADHHLWTSVAEIRSYIWIQKVYYYYFKLPASLFKHVQHFCLKHWIHRFHTDTLKSNLKLLSSPFSWEQVNKSALLFPIVAWQTRQ